MDELAIKIEHVSKQYRLGAIGMSAMLKGCYLVNNDSDLKKTIDMLLAGEDPLAPVRSEVCDTVLLQGDNDKASENMKQILLNGYRK